MTHVKGIPKVLIKITLAGRQRVIKALLAQTVKLGHDFYLFKYKYLKAVCFSAVKRSIFHGGD